MDYTGIKCPVCGKAFTKQDDVVVCPECGAPYHRECYRNTGHCIFLEKHEKGKLGSLPRKPVKVVGMKRRAAAPAAEKTTANMLYSAIIADVPF